MFKESRMGITMFGFGGLLASLQGLAGCLVQASRQRAMAFVRTRRAAPAAPQFSRETQARSCNARSAASSTHRYPADRPLRVVRVMETRTATRSSGRMVISGRLADVCAELDRLAELEAAAG
jgi:hypothetical protein